VRHIVLDLHFPIASCLTDTNKKISYLSSCLTTGLDRLNSKFLKSTQRLRIRGFNRILNANFWLFGWIYRMLVMFQLDAPVYKFLNCT
jgi:hypothetical protein